jgi:hypothetical protein
VALPDGMPKLYGDSLSPPLPCADLLGLQRTSWVTSLLCYKKRWYITFFS